MRQRLVAFIILLFALTVALGIRTAAAAEVMVLSAGAPEAALTYGL